MVDSLKIAHTGEDGNYKSSNENSTDGNIHDIIEHIYVIYEPLKLALQTHGTIKTDIKIITIVISIT